MNKTIPNTITVTVADSSCDDKIEITLNRYSDTLNRYSDLNDWIKVFKTILIHQTFCEDTVKELFEYPCKKCDGAHTMEDEIEYYNSSFNTPPLVPWWNKPANREE
jgi:hypothetical protein